MTPLLVPTLRTVRLTLRAPAIADFESCYAAWTDPVVIRFIGGRPSSREEAWGRVLRYIGHWQALGYGMWVVEDRATGAWLGEVGFGDFHREMEPSFGVTPEMGWVLGPAAHGRGVATEAVGAGLAWADARWPVTGCIIAPDNTASLRVAEKAGFREKLRTSYRGDPTVVLERPAPTSST